MSRDWGQGGWDLNEKSRRWTAAQRFHYDRVKLTTNEQLVSKVWNYAHALRDQGISNGDYFERITYLLSFKMDHECVDLHAKLTPQFP